MEIDHQELRAFERGELDPASFHHRDHVRIAWRLLRSRPLLEALDRFAGGLRRFASATGKPELYHETITWSYLLLIHERLARASDAERDGWDAFAAANPDLFAWKPGILERYYLPATLSSELARRTFVLPDRGLSVAGSPS